ncbi:MAG: MerR family transcriptional regulator [Candidatus Eremiobacteraeota bacterium]|nr:MerR family transcriptional regulator [Candidatus Eremiobacteraeota bacterium]
MSGTYSIAAVARRTGLNPDTIRAWERRYQLIEPRRESSGVRIYSDREVVRLELARDATLRGHAIRHAAKLSNAALRRLVLIKPAAAAANSDSSPTDRFISETIDAIKNYDLGAAQRSLTAAALIMSKDDLALRVLAPLLRQVGEDWSSGRLAIAQEHAVSQIVRNVTGGLTLQNINGQKTDPAMVFSTPPGESHEFGIMLGALIAVAHGRKTMLLGPGLPADELARAARRIRAHIIVIGSVAQPEDATVPAFLKELDGATPTGTALWVGGPHAALFCKKSGVGRAEAIPTLEALSDRLRSPVT